MSVHAVEDASSLRVPGKGASLRSALIVESCISMFLLCMKSDSKVSPSSSFKICDHQQSRKGSLF